MNKMKDLKKLFNNWVKLTVHNKNYSVDPIKISIRGREYIVKDIRSPHSTTCEEDFTLVLSGIGENNDNI